jgi:hypothetical protein
MLDLQKTVKEMFYDIKLIDGTELQLKRPKQGMVEFVVGLQGYVNSNKELEVIDGFKKIFVDILNRNINNVTFSADDIGEEYDISIIAMVIKDYFQFWNDDMQKQVDFQ